MPITIGGVTITTINVIQNGVTTSLDSVYANGVEVFSTIPQLATPSNVVVSGTTATLDVVENATSYDIRIDGTSIGTYIPWEYPVVEGDNLIITQVYGATESGTNLTLE